MGLESFASGPAARGGLTRRQTLGAGAAGAAAMVAGGTFAAAPALAAGEPRTFSQGFNTQTQRALTSILISGSGADQIPGMAVGIWAPGQGNYVAAMGTSDRATGAPLSLSDHFRIASVSKSFIAHTVLRLVDQRRMTLADKLESFVPGIPHGKQITVQQLLAMTSGVYDYVNDPDLTIEETANPLLPFSLADVVRIINEHEPAFAPGADAMYDNSNYYLLGAIIEKVTGNPLHRVVKSQVLDPLGLSQTSYPTTPAIPAPFSRGYFYEPNLGHRDVTASNPAFAGGAGAMISTLSDLKVWAKALATGALLKPATQALRLKSHILAQTPKITLTYGLGITEVNGFLGHDGAIVGYGSVVLYLPSRKATIVILGNNNDNGNPAPLNIGLSVAAFLFPEQFPKGL
ncbi:MAG TPA: serine hydrolase domain-containing protein [Frankiaceae bacterium]|nr:serine hydrolase domain-containing protein [Frankiaceae bacterium]